MCRRRNKVSLYVLAVLSLVWVSCNRKSVAEHRSYDAIRYGDTNYLRQYFKSYRNITQCLEYTPYTVVSAPPLDISVEYGQVDLVADLLAKGADPNQRDSNGDTPLIWAICHGVATTQTNLRIVKMLLSAGANPNVPESANGGRTPLIWATELDQT